MSLDEAYRQGMADYEAALVAQAQQQAASPEAYYLQGLADYEQALLEQSAAAEAGAGGGEAYYLQGMADYEALLLQQHQEAEATLAAQAASATPQSEAYALGLMHYEAELLATALAEAAKNLSPEQRDEYEKGRAAYEAAVAQQQQQAGEQQGQGGQPAAGGEQAARGATPDVAGAAAAAENEPLERIRYSRVDITRRQVTRVARHPSDRRRLELRPEGILRLQRARQLRHGRRLEQRAHRKLDLHHALNRGEQPRDEQRVASQVGEEIVVSLDVRDPEQLAPHARQRLFDAADRRASAAGLGAMHERIWQCGSIDFAGRRQR